MANEPETIDLGGIDDSVDTFSQEERIEELEKIQLDSSAIKQVQTSTPTYEPNNWYQQISLTANNLWVNINNVWNNFINANGTTAYTATGAGFKDEDDMASDSAVATASQQSIKAYVDALSFNNKLTLFTTNVNVVSTTTDTDLMSFSIAANTLSTDNLVKVRIYIGELDINNGQTGAVKLKYGGTTVCTATLTSDGSTTNYKGYIDVELYSRTTSQQEGSLTVWTHGAGNDARINAESADGVSNEDSTGTLTLAISIEWSAAQAGNNIDVYNGYAIII